MIPRAFVQDLLSRVDIVDIIERHLPLKKGGANYFACCPFHGEKTPSFSISPTKQFYHCFGCGVHGNAISFLMEYGNLSFVEAVEDLAKTVGVDVPREDSGNIQPIRRQEENEPLLLALSAASEFYRSQLRQHPDAIAYLKRRGLSGDIATRFGIGFAPDAWQGLSKVFPEYDNKTLLDAGLVIDNEAGRRYDRFRGRIMFPIHDRRGRIIAFGGRVLDKGEPKYLNSPETVLFEKGRELYGLHLAQQGIRDAGFVLVVEGYMDVVSLAQFGLGNAVATLGTSTSAHHIKSLLRHTDRIVFCFDGDKAGRKAAWRALESSLEALRDGTTLSFLFLPEGHDPDTFIREKGSDTVRQEAAKATPLISFLLSELTARTDLSSAEGRARLIHDAAPLLGQIVAPLIRLQLVKQLAELSGLTQEEVQASCGRATQPDAEKTSLQSHPTPNQSPIRHTHRPLTTRRPRPNSPAHTLLRLSLMHLDWLARLPADLIPLNDAHGRALAALVDATSIGDINPNHGLGALIEPFRNTEHGDTLSSAAAELIANDYDENVAELLFEDTVRKLHMDAIEREIRAITTQIRENGPGGDLGHQLNALLLEKAKLNASTRVS